MKTEAYQEITNSILEVMEQGKLPWEVPFHGEARFTLQKNHATQLYYRGINFWNLLLVTQKRGYLSNEWMTFNQASTVSKRIKRNEKSSRIIFYKLVDKDTEKTTVESGDAEKMPILKTSCVFNLCQIEGAEQEILAAHNIKTEVDFKHIDLTGLRADISHQTISKAFYKPSADRIYLPMKEQFKSESDYYATVFHELIHWTGHPSRLNRPQSHEEEIYAFEELVAEFGAAYLSTYFGYKYVTQHASYIQGWFEVLKKKPSLLIKATSQAQKAADYIISELNS